MIPESGRLTAMKLLLKKETIHHIEVKLAQAFGAGADDILDFFDFTECDFDGYAAITNPTWADPALNVDGLAEALSETLVWTAGSGISAPQTIVAVWWEVYFDSSGGIDPNMFWFKKILPTVTLAAPGEQFIRIIDFLDDDDSTFD